jgi:hypothetical protein
MIYTETKTDSVVFYKMGNYDYYLIENIYWYWLK